MKAQFNQMLDEQINKIRTYEARVCKAKLNYTKALQRLEELNSQIYDQNSKCKDEEEVKKSEVRDGSIFDAELLSQLVLQDDVDENLDLIRQQCLTQL